MASPVAELLVKLGVRLDGSVKAQDGLRKLKKRAGEFGDSADTAAAKAKRLARGVGRVLVKAAKVGAAALAAYGVALGKLVLNKAEAIDATNKLSDALGTDIEELQRLQFAAERSGLSQANLEKGIRNLNKAILEVGQGAGGVAKKALDDLGLSLDDLDGLSQSQQIGKIGDALNGLEDDAQRSALAAQLFGQRAGPEMASMLFEGSDGLRELMDQTQGVFTQAEADRASAMQDRITDLKNTIDAFATDIAVDLIPIVTEWIELAQAWFAENEEMIKQDFAGTVVFVVDVVKELAAEAGVLIDIIRALGKAYSDAGDRTDVFGQAVSGIVWIVKQALSPLQNIRTLLGEMANLLDELGIISTKSADDFNLAIGNMETSASGVDRISGKYDRLVQSIDDAARAQFDFAQDMRENFAFDATGEESRKLARANDREQERKRRAARARARASRPARSATDTKPKAPPKAPPPKTVTMEDLRRRLLGGDMTALRENLADLSSSSASIADTKPSVVIHHTDNSTHVRVEQVDVQVDGAGSPAATAQAVGSHFEKAVRKAILRDNAKTARAIPNTVVR